MDSIEQREREQFEAAMRTAKNFDPFVLERDANGDYAVAIAEAAWQGWRMRAALSAPAIVHSKRYDGWKLGDEFLPFHPSASHIDPDYRDGWNACFHAAAALSAPQAIPKFDELDDEIVDAACCVGMISRIDFKIAWERARAMLEAAPPAPGAPAQVPAPPVLTWTDKHGAKNTIPFDAAVKLLKKFYDRWPGGLDEIEASIERWRLAAARYGHPGAVCITGVHPDAVVPAPGDSGAAVAVSPMTINGEAPNARNLLAALVDIHDDRVSQPEEHRCYVPEAWADVLKEAREFLSAAPPAAEPSKAAPVLLSEEDVFDNDDIISINGEFSQLAMNEFMEKVVRPIESASLRANGLGGGE